MAKYELLFRQLFFMIQVFWIMSTTDVIPSRMFHNDHFYFGIQIPCICVIFVCGSVCVVSLKQFFINSFTWVYLTHRKNGCLHNYGIPVISRNRLTMTNLSSYWTGRGVGVLSWIRLTHIKIKMKSVTITYKYMYISIYIYAVTKVVFCL